MRLHPTHAAAMGVVSGQRIRVQIRHGGIEAAADVNEEVLPGQFLIPFGYWEAAANKLTGDAIDSDGKGPGVQGDGGEGSGVAGADRTGGAASTSGCQALSVAAGACKRSIVKPMPARPCIRPTRTSVVPSPVPA